MGDIEPFIINTGLALTKYLAPPPPQSNGALARRDDITEQCPLVKTVASAFSCLSAIDNVRQVCSNEATGSIGADGNQTSFAEFARKKKGCQERPGLVLFFPLHFAFLRTASCFRTGDNKLYVFDKRTIADL